MKPVKILLFFFVLSWAAGQLVRIPIGPTGAFQVYDLVAGFLFLSWLVWAVGIKRQIKLPQGANWLFVFIVLALIALVNSARLFSLSQIIAGSLFLLRFILYASLYIIVFNTIKKDEVKIWTKLLIGSALIVAAVGFGQLFFFPDLTFLSQFGWDPHQGRLVSTFLDPNFVGGFLGLAFILATAQFFEDKKPFNIFSSLVFFLATILTFSRSAYLMLAVATILFGILKSRQLLVGALVLFLVLLVTIPRISDRITGGIQIDVTAAERLESWSKAAAVFGDNFLLGVGFNNYRFAQADYGFFTPDQPLGGLSGGGADSSLFLVAATTGILGLVFFGLFWLRIFQFQLKRLSNFLSLAVLISITSLIFESQFVNSLFYPPIAGWVFILIGLATLSQK